ncbi:hypothetical protein FB558_5227 [Pseudonocardia kunmingensis]|uniref:Uncharacterized protein n=1 Tax=Pseudonocardia kunmingensis TaxID=630975 RepID=A0A543DJF7_9PSEU|nr:hypothetical protein FB558_5227 [Pseudonocardia kunmingensis]
MCEVARVGDSVGPFGPVVTGPGDVDAYIRLAGYTGRQP